MSVAFSQFIESIGQGKACMASLSKLVPSTFSPDYSQSIKSWSFGKGQSGWMGSLGPLIDTFNDNETIFEVVYIALSLFWIMVIGTS